MLTAVLDAFFVSESIIGMAFAPLGFGCCGARRLRKGISTTSLIDVEPFVPVVSVVLSFTLACFLSLLIVALLADFFLPALVLSPNAFRLRAGGAVVGTVARALADASLVLRTSVRLRVVTVRAVRCPVF
jgi:hypothetical protein